MWLHWNWRKDWNKSHWKWDGHEDFTRNMWQLFLTSYNKTKRPAAEKIIDLTAEMLSRSPREHIWRAAGHLMSRNNVTMWQWCLNHLKPMQIIIIYPWMVPWYSILALEDVYDAEGRSYLKAALGTRRSGTTKHTDRQRRKDRCTRTTTWRCGMPTMPFGERLQGQALHMSS